MKTIKKAVAVILAMAVIMAMGLTAMAKTTTTGAVGGTGTITVKNATSGQEYKAYKIFDASYSTTTDGGNSTESVSYKLAASIYDGLSDDDKTAFDAVFTVTGPETIGSTSYYTVSKNKNATENAVLGYVKTNYTKFDATGTVLTNDGKGNATKDGMPYGYYYVTSTLGSTVTIDTVNPTADILDKNSTGPNDPDKKITAENGTNLTSEAEKNDAAVGSTESFKVTYDATDYVTSGSGTSVTTQKVTKYTIVDTPTGLDIDTSKVVVKVGETEVYKNGAAVGSSGVTVTETGSTTTLTTVIPWVNASGEFLYTQKKGGAAETTVTITYDAEILQAAATDVAENEVEIKYTNDSNVESSLEEKPKTETTTYKVALEKVDKDDTTTKLAGAEFELYLGETKVSFTKSGDVYTVADSKATTGTTTTTITSTTGLIKIKGLDKVEYTLKETKAPEGYNIAEDTTFTPSVACDADDQSTADVTVKDSKGALLPATGGMGTTLFYTFGAILVIGAGVIMITRRRMEEQ